MLIEPRSQSIWRQIKLVEDMKYIIPLLLICSACSSVSYNINGKMIDGRLDKFTYFHGQSSEDNVLDETVNLIEENTRYVGGNKSIFVFPVQFNNLRLDDQIVSRLQKNLDWKNITTESLLNIRMDIENIKDKFGCNDTECYMEIAGALDADYILKIDISHIKNISVDRAPKGTQRQKILDYEKDLRTYNRVLWGWTLSVIFGLFTGATTLVAFSEIDTQKIGSQKSAKMQDISKGVGLICGISTVVLLSSTLLYQYFGRRP